MTRLFRRLAPWAAAVIIALLLSLPALAAPQRHVLDNGLTVITDENHEAPVVAFQVWVRAGSAYERPGEYGITHLIEHMIFKGSPAHPGGEMARRIEALGGEVNAYTTIDHTNYYVVADSRHSGEVLGLLSDAVVNAYFDQSDLKREQEVVVEEIRMGEDNPDRRRMKALMKASFGADHPYGRPVIGTRESVRAITRQDILDYRNRWYRAPNMLVVAVGDFKTDQILPRIKEAFAGLSREKAPAFRLPPVATDEGPKLVVMKEKVKQAAVSLAWVIPGLPDTAVYPLDLAGDILGGGETSRLWLDLKEKKSLVDQVDASSYTPHGVGVFEVEAELAPAKVLEAWPALLERSLDLVRRPPTPAELKRARVNLAASFVRARQTMQGQARYLGYFEMMHGGFEAMQTYLARYQALGAAEVSSAARRYMTPGRLAVVVQVPEDGAAPELDQLKARVAAVEAALPPAQDQDRATAARHQLANGMTLIIKPAHAVPLVSYVLSAPGGQAAEPAGQAGLFQLWSRAVTRGTQKTPQPEMVRRLEDMAGSLDAFAGKSTVGLSASFLSRDWKRGLAMLGETWLTPGLKPAEVAKAKAEQAAALRAQQNSPVSRAFIAFRRLVYGDHPYGNNPLGSAESLAALGPAELKAAHARVKGPGGTVLAVVGDVDPDEALAEVERIFGPATGQAKEPLVGPPTPPSHPRAEAISDPQAAQTQIVVGFLAPSAVDPRRHALNLWQAILGGQGGRLFRELRDKRSLAYAVQPFYSTGEHAGVLGFYLGVGPGKEKEALAGLQEQIDLVRREPPSAEELARAQSYTLGGLAIGLQSYSAQAMTMAVDEILGLGYDQYQRTPAEVMAVTPEAALEVARETLVPDHRTSLTLGR